MSKKSQIEVPDYHTKKQIGVRLTDAGHGFLDALVVHLGIGKADVIEMGLRELARKFKLTS